jgi:hypothetical protein
LSAEAIDATWMPLPPMTREVPVWMIKEDEQLHPKADTRDFQKAELWQSTLQRHSHHQEA